jgi:signal transduction histidine kinase
MNIEDQDAALAAIAADVHDDLNPHLLIAKQKLELAVPVIERLGLAAEQREELLDLIRASRDEMLAAYAAMRRIVAGQTPEVLTLLGLSAACDDLAGQAKSMQLDVETSGLHCLDSVRRERQLAVYRLVQEALTNAAKHSMAKHAWITAELNDEGLAVTICDDGTGIEDVAERLAEPVFMHSLKQRCGALDARLDVVGKGERGGLALTVQLPMHHLALPS